MEHQAELSVLNQREKSKSAVAHPFEARGVLSSSDFRFNERGAFAQYADTEPSAFEQGTVSIPTCLDGSLGIVK